jgi:Trk K+ transport system NAD-binding subunit
MTSKDQVGADRTVILCGLGRVGWHVFDLLQAAKIPVVVIDQLVNPADPRLAGIRVVRGDFRDRVVLEEAGIASARGAIILASDDLVNVSAALTVRQLNKDARIVVRMFNQNLLDRLGQTVTKTVALSVSALTAPLLALTALTGETVGAFTTNETRRQLTGFSIAAGAPLVNCSVADVAQKYNVLPVALTLSDGTCQQCHEIDVTHLLAPGDEIVICGEPHRIQELLPLGQAQDWERLIPGVQWAGKMRRWGRVLIRTLADVDLALKITGLVLAAVILVSTLIYWYFGLSTSLPDGMYRTISVMATGADMKADNYVGWQKIFVSVLRILGALLTAAFTAIFTKYLIRARLGGAFEMRRIPDSGHVIVCGLGHVGYRVCEELLAHGERVVVIEKASDNSLAASARRMGAAVIVGDATIIEVLKQSRAGAARALIACTSNDLANLEIALLARELNQRQRLVLRMGDPQLAETARAAANLPWAVSLPKLAAPAYVAALYGDRVMTMFQAGTQMLLVVELAVHADDPCLKSQSIRALTMDYQFAPVALLRDLQALPMIPSTRVEPGDRLTVIGEIASLERLFRREQAPADFTIELEQVPDSAVEKTKSWLKVEAGLGETNTESAFQHLPFRLAGRYSRGRANDLVDLLTADGVLARVVTASSSR